MHAVQAAFIFGSTDIAATMRKMIVVTVTAIQHHCSAVMT